MRDGWIILHTYINDLEAQAARSVLVAHGLQAMIEVDNCGGMRPHFDLTSGIKLLVPENEAQQAREMIQPAEEATTSESWLCAGCGESIEANFATCWKCGQDRN